MALQSAGVTPMLKNALMPSVPKLLGSGVLQRIGQHQAGDEYVDEPRLMFPAAIDVVLIAHCFAHFFGEAPTLQYRLADRGLPAADEFHP